MIKIDQMVNFDRRPSVGGSRSEGRAGARCLEGSTGARTVPRPRPVPDTAVTLGPVGVFPIIEDYSNGQNHRFWRF